MNTVKRILAIAALAAAAVFVVMTLYFIVTGQIVGNGNRIILPLTVFLTLGLLCLAINWLQNLKKEKEKERQEQASK